MSRQPGGDPHYPQQQNPFGSNHGSLGGGAPTGGAGAYNQHGYDSDDYDRNRDTYNSEEGSGESRERHEYSTFRCHLSANSV
jgi:hypothetical protein